MKQKMDHHSNLPKIFGMLNRTNSKIHYKELPEILYFEMLELLQYIGNRSSSYIM